jgi:hypothetical protein
MDHYINSTFVHLQKSTNAQETLEAKQAFERWADSHHVQIWHYHADSKLLKDGLTHTTYKYGITMPITADLPKRYSWQMSPRKDK